MNNFRILIASLLLVFAAFQMTAFAESIEGIVVSVDAEFKELEIGMGEDSYWVGFNSDTQWPVGVTDPSQLNGSLVSVEVDDATEMALSVSQN